MAFLSLLCTFQPNLGNVFLSDTVNMSILEIVVLFVFYEQQVAASAQCSVSSAVLSQRHCVMDSRLTYHLLELMLLMILLMLIFHLLLISRIKPQQHPLKKCIFVLRQSHLNLNTYIHLLSLRVPGAAALVRREESSSTQKRESGSTSSAGSTREEEEIMMEPIPRVEEEAAEVIKRHF